MQEFRELDLAYQRAATDAERYKAASDVVERFPAAFAFQILKTRYSPDQMQDLDTALQYIPRSTDFWCFYLQLAAYNAEISQYLPDLYQAAALSVGCLAEAGDFWHYYAVYDEKAAFANFPAASALCQLEGISQVQQVEKQEVALHKALFKLNYHIRRHFFSPEAPSYAETAAVVRYARMLLLTKPLAFDALLERLIMDYCNCEELALVVLFDEPECRERFAEAFRFFGKAFSNIQEIVAAVLEDDANESKDLRLAYLQIKRKIARGQLKEAAEQFSSVTAPFGYSTDIERRFGRLAVQLDLFMGNPADINAAKETIISNVLDMWRKYGKETAVLIANRLQLNARTEELLEVSRCFLALQELELANYYLLAAQGFC